MAVAAVAIEAVAPARVVAAVAIEPAVAPSMAVAALVIEPAVAPEALADHKVGNCP